MQRPRAYRQLTLLIPLALALFACSPAMAPPAPPPLLLYAAPLSAEQAQALAGAVLPERRFRFAPAATDALQKLRDGSAAAALYVTSPGEADPPALAAQVLAVEPGQVLLQPWLDPPLQMTATQARDALAKALTAAPRSGQLAAAAWGVPHLGWLPIRIDGVAPVRETLLSGRYPLARRLLLLGALPGAAPGAAPLPTAALPAGFVPAASLADPVSLTAVGDFMLSRAVAPLLQKNGPDFLLAGVQDALKGDLVFGNLESPIGVKGRPLPDKGIWFRAPPEAVNVLKAAGATAVTVANNHILDYDSENFLETLDYLQGAGIKWAGGGRTLAEARKPTVISAGGVRVAIVAASEFADLYYSEKYSRRYTATDVLPGVVPLRRDYLAEDIAAARQVADIVLVTFHWGIEYQNYPTPEMVRVAHFCIDQGADLVLGHHPHAIQGFDIYKGHFIAYSMGNFIMDDQSLGRLQQESMILHLGLTPGGVNEVSVTPVLAPLIGRPVVQQGEAAAQLMAKYRHISGWDEPDGKVPGW